MTMKKVKTQKSHSITMADKIGNFVAKMSFFLILILLPLYMDKKFYLAMINAKGQCFTVISITVFVGILVYIIAFLVNRKHRKMPRKQLAFVNWNTLDWAVLLLGVSVFISFLLSADKKMCLWGTGGFRVGTYMTLALIIIYFFTSRHLTGGKELWDMVFIVSDVIFLWIFSNSISVDILNMHAQIMTEQYFGYFASLGQMNCVTAYICLLLPVGIVFFAESPKREDLIFYGIFIFLAMLSLLCIQTDGVYIGLAFCCLFLFPYMFSTYGRCVRFLQVGLLVGGALLVVKVLFLFIPQRMKVDTTSVSYNLSRYWVCIPVILLCIVLLYLVKKYNAKLTSKVLKRISIGMVFLDALIIIGYSIYSVFHFATGWGNGRNAIWSASVKVFQEYTPLEKLFGLGTDMIRERLTPLVGWNVGVANCHNNILECLLCLGAIGLVAYLFLWIAIVKSWFHKDRILWSAEQTGYFMALIAYFGQSIVGNPYSLTIPMAFMLLTLYRSEQSGRALTL